MSHTEWENCSQTGGGVEHVEYEAGESVYVRVASRVPRRRVETGNADGGHGGPEATCSLAGPGLVSVRRACTVC